MNKKWFELSFPDALGLIGMVPVLKSWKAWHYWTYCHFCVMVQASISLWLLKLFFQIGLHIICTSGYIFLCKFWEAYLVCSSYSSVTQMMNSLGWRDVQMRVLICSIKLCMVLLPYICQLKFSARSVWPGLCIQCTSYTYKLMQTILNTRSSIWPLHSGIISLPSLSCQITWA